MEYSLVSRQIWRGGISFGEVSEKGSVGEKLIGKGTELKF